MAARVCRTCASSVKMWWAVEHDLGPLHVHVWLTRRPCWSCMVPRPGVGWWGQSYFVTRSGSIADNKGSGPFFVAYLHY